jgi:hypothetical protein
MHHDNHDKILLVLVVLAKMLSAFPASKPSLLSSSLTYNASYCILVSAAMLDVLEE